jgi:cobalt/nickel transport system ATP-binding protein
VKTNNTVIELKKISFGYPSGTRVLEGLDFTLCQGEKIGLIAPNGSGKTTLFHVIMGLLKPQAGTIDIFGRKVTTEKDFQSVRRRIGLLFQDADDQLFSPTVLEDVAFGPLNLGKSREEAIELSDRTLRFLGLNGFQERITFKLSGGEKKLVALATVLAMEPEVLLLDEPTAGLDMATKEKLTGILNSLELSCVLISHEFDFLRAVADHIYAMENGKVLMDEEVQAHVHEHAHRQGKHPHRH